MYFVADESSIQIFPKDSGGTCIQRLSNGKQNNVIFGICIMDNLLCISDYNNSCIQISKRQELMY